MSKINIDAAPDMLAALKTLDMYWTESFPSGPDPDSEPSPVNEGLAYALKARLAEETIQLWRQVRAAIAKAEK